MYGREAEIACINALLTEVEWTGASVTITRKIAILTE